MEKTVRVGVMPGRISEYAVEVGMSIQDLLNLAELDTTGFEVKVDGAKVTDLEGTKITESTNLVLLCKLVKGNSDKLVRVGVMPGRITEYAVEVGTSVADVLALAELDVTGYECKVDGTKVDPTSAVVTENTNLILLVKLVKGNIKR